MLYVDYTFDVLENGTIIFDKEITLKDLHADENDVYSVKLINGKVVLSKKDD